MQTTVHEVAEVQIAVSRSICSTVNSVVLHSAIRLLMMTQRTAELYMWYMLSQTWMSHWHEYIVPNGSVHQLRR